MPRKNLLGTFLMALKQLPFHDGNWSQVIPQYLHVYTAAQMHRSKPALDDLADACLRGIQVALKIICNIPGIIMEMYNEQYQHQSKPCMRIGRH